MASRSLPNYVAGTVSIVNGSRAVTGVGTLWASAGSGTSDAQVAAGDQLRIGTARPVIIESVNSDTSITLVEPWPHGTASGAAYAILRYVALPTGAVLAALQSLSASAVLMSPAGDAAVTRDLAIGRNAAFAGDVAVTRDLAIGRNAAFAGDVAVTGALTVSGIAGDVLSTRQDGLGPAFGSSANVPLRLVVWGAERLRIDTAGRVLIGTPDFVLNAAARLTLLYLGGPNEFGLTLRPAVNNTTPIALVNAAGGFVGSVSISATATSYNTTSDERLKTIRGPIASGAVLDGLDPFMHGWDAAPDEHPVPGLSAQAVHAIAPYAVTPGRGAPGDEDFLPWAADWSRLVPVLVAELKSVRSRLAAVENVLNPT